ncbi:MAG: type II toxin-antitoxin system PemK/MazF family toxin [Chloroflexota bacterium]
MTTSSVRRGDVWVAEMPDDKRRPLLVLTRDPLGRLLPSDVCAPITSTIRGLPTEVTLGPEPGLVQDSVANFDHALLLDRSRLIRRLGRASPVAMEAACGALAIATGCRT